MKKQKTRIRKTKDKIIVCYIPCSNKKEASSVTEVLLKKRLIACAGFWPVNSIFFWPPKSRKLVGAREVVIFAKTKKKNFKALEKEVKKIHSYKVPCIIAWELSNINKDYLDWLVSEIK